MYFDIHLYIFLKSWIHSFLIHCVKAIQIYFAIKQTMNVFLTSKISLDAILVFIPTRDSSGLKKIIIIIGIFKYSGKQILNLFNMLLSFDCQLTFGLLANFLKKIIINYQIRLKLTTNCVDNFHQSINFF